MLCSVFFRSLVRAVFRHCGISFVTSRDYGLTPFILYWCDGKANAFTRSYPDKFFEGYKFLELLVDNPEMSETD
jgi:hypothetical protein